MNEILLLLMWLIRFYILILILRIIIEMIQSFSRNWRPQRWFSIVAEPLFVVTDPPVKALRKLIPPVQLGGVGLDVSVLVLFFGLQLLSMLLGAFVR
ncbi:MULTISPECIES: YggT family protein [unclassified Corynebacterium]|uniref:YggT family protein n=1 Tax=unclassified Corynebacterium TaxID=2624378 RepID=UPI001EF71CB9|nr:YggT family protein [Corynebacterium sp. ACRQK]MCG7263128.1 YggT family protein [Corynebacterium sp. ACRQL]